MASSIAVMATEIEQHAGIQAFLAAQQQKEPLPQNTNGNTAATQYPSIATFDLQALLAERQTLQGYLKQSRSFLGFGSKLVKEQERNYKARISAIEKLIFALTCIGKALDAQYEPYTMPANYYVGVITSNDAWHDIRLQYTAPIPPEHYAAYSAAKKSGFFDNILIGSTDENAFRVSRPMNIDPAIVGYIHLRAAPSFNSSYVVPHLRTLDAVGFLITQWGMKEELQRGGVL